MEIKTFSFTLETKAGTDIVDITDKVRQILTESELTEGSALIFVPGSTAGISTIEYEPGLLQDYPEFLERIAPANMRYAHNNTWHDGNGYSHVRATFQGASLTVPFSGKRLLLGTWQQIILLDFDNKTRSRKVIVQLTGKTN